MNRKSARKVVKKLTVLVVQLRSKIIRAQVRSKICLSKIYFSSTMGLKVD